VILLSYGPYRKSQYQVPGIIWALALRVHVTLLQVQFVSLYVR